MYQQNLVYGDFTSIDKNIVKRSFRNANIKIYHSVQLSSLRPFPGRASATSRIYPVNFDVKKTITLPGMGLAYIKFIENVLNGRT